MLNDSAVPGFVETMLMHSVIYHIVHFILNVIVYLEISYKFIQKAITIWPSKSIAFSAMRAHSKELTKLPMHIGFLVLEDNFNMDDIAKLCIWAFCVGVPCISVYDVKGYIKSNLSCFTEHVNEVLKNTIGKGYDKYRLQISRYNSVQQPTRAFKDIDLNIWLLSSSDGQGQIVTRTQEFCMTVKGHRAQIAELDTQYFHNLLDQGNEMTADPDLAVVLGPVTSLMGYLPWHTRLTEILCLPTHHRVSYAEFHQLLRRYSKCDQRVGR